MLYVNNFVFFCEVDMYVYIWINYIKGLYLLIFNFLRLKIRL